MVKVIYIEKFLELIRNKDCSLNIKTVKNKKDLEELFTIFDNNNTKIIKQVGIKIPNNYNSKIKCRGNIPSLVKNDVLIVYDFETYYLIIVEEIFKEKEEV